MKLTLNILFNPEMWKLILPSFLEEDNSAVFEEIQFLTTAEKCYNGKSYHWFY